MRQPLKGESARTTLQTVDRALSVLEYVAERHRPPTLREVSTDLGLNITTVYHLFNTLEHRGYLVRDAEGGLRIGASAAVIHRALMSGLTPARDLRPVLDGLAAATAETAYLTGWNDDAVVILAVVDAPHSLRVSGLYVGFRGNEVKRASGKAVLAHLPPDPRARVLDRNLRSLEPAARAQAESDLSAEFDAVVRDGVAIDDQRYTAGVCCVAAPYFTADGAVRGSVTVSAPAIRFQERRDLLISSVLDAARTCSEWLGQRE